MTSIARAQIESIVEAAVLAPSADNRHLVEFELMRNGILLWGNKEFTEAPFHRRILCLIGFGAMAENMLLRAGSLGLAGAVEWFPDPSRPELVARMTLRAERLNSEDIAAAISARHTNRRLFRGPPLTTSERATLEAEVARIPGVRLFWFDQPAARRMARRLLHTAESERFYCRPLHEELFSSIRFEAGWHSPTDRGLPPGSLGIGYFGRLGFSALRNWHLMRALNAIGGHRLIGFRAASLPCWRAPHLCALATTLTLDEGSLAVGQALERAWLSATRFGLAFQPFAAPALLALDGYTDVRAEVQSVLAKGWAELTPGVTPLIVFRMGRAAPPPVRSKRLPIQGYLRSGYQG